MKRAPGPVRQDPWQTLSSLTSARIGLGRAGGSLPTRALLAFQLAHARARDAVHRELDAERLAAELVRHGPGVLHLHSAARDRASFIARPDLGRILDDPSRIRLEGAAAAGFDLAFIVADGLSAQAVESHAARLLDAVMPRVKREGWSVAPLCIVRQGRVAVGDEVGALLQARLAVLLIGERPGLSSPDSLGVYLTHDPLPGRTNAERNCLSNIRPPEGLSYALAAHKLHYLMGESLRRGLTGVDLKEQAGDFLPSPSAAGAPVDGPGSV